MLKYILLYTMHVNELICIQKIRTSISTSYLDLYYYIFIIIVILIIIILAIIINMYVCMFIAKLNRSVFCNMCYCAPVILLILLSVRITWFLNTLTM